jgi:hypothetical protein
MTIARMIFLEIQLEKISIWDLQESPHVGGALLRTWLS